MGDESKGATDFQEVPLDDTERPRERRFNKALKDPVVWVFGISLYLLFLGWVFTQVIFFYGGIGRLISYGILAVLPLILAAFIARLWTHVATNDTFLEIDRRSAKLKSESSISLIPSPLAEELVQSSSDFVKYFLNIKQILESKATTSDEKASMALDRGLGFTYFGICLYLAMILIWQAMFYLHGFKPELLYGIASGTFLFIFIEFLSAWFLRQYRYFVDTSTYLIKIKSLLDRYLLTYFALTDGAFSNTLKSTPLTEILAENIKWPDVYLFKKADSGFAKEAVEAVTQLSSIVKELKEEKEKTGTKAKEGEKEGSNGAKPE